MNGQSMTAVATRLVPRTGQIFVLAICAFAAAFYLPDPVIGLGFFVIGLTFLALVAISQLLHARRKMRLSRLMDEVASLTDADPTACAVTDAEGRIRYANPAAKKFTGPDHETLATALAQHVASAPVTVRRLRNKVELRGSAREEVVARTGNMRLTAHPVGGECLLWRIEEVAERAAPGRSADAVTLPMMTVSKAGTVLFMNDALRRLLGGRRANLERIVNDMPLRPGDLHELAGPDGPVCARLHVVDKVVGRKEIYVMPSDEVAKGPAYSWEGLDQLPVPILKVAADGRITASNAQARGMLNIEADASEFLGDLVEGLGRSVADWLGDAAERQGQVQSEFVRATRRSDEVFLQITLSRVIEDGETSLVVILNDATKLKTLEAQFVQSQKMQAIGQLAGGVAHDFNNLLTAISGHCDLLMLRHDENDPDYGDLAQINQNANRAASLVGQLLAFSRKQTLKPEVLEIEETLDDLAHLLNRLVGERVTLTLDNGRDLPLIRADKRQLEQVLMNLVVNARDAMPDGGEIRIQTRAEQLSEPYERDRAVVPPGDYVVISVNDQGMGMPAEVLAKIFEPFYTTKKTGEGTGLGLSMAYGIVKQTGGYIFANSVVGSGTCFTLFFPAYAPAECRQADEADTAAAPRRGEVQSARNGVVLLVEDEAPVRAFASRALKLRGFTVVEAACAEEALKTLEDPELSIDVFVTDVVMPGMDGPSWVAQALQERPDTRVVFVSGYAEDSFSDQQARIPNSVFLPKPFSLSELTSTVQNQLH